MGDRVHRYDTGTLKPAEKLANGWLRVEGRTAKVGILEYDQADGSIRRELVLPEDLFNHESMASARMVPVTAKHPEALLDDKTVRAHQVGSVGENLRADGEFLVAPMLITDADTVGGIERGDSGLSWGYDCTLDPPDQTLFPKWGQHENIQRQRIYNHIATRVVPRAGANARIRLDAAGNACDPFASGDTSMVASPSAVPPETHPMKIKIGKHHLDATDANASIVQDAIDRELADVTARADSAEKAKADALAEAAKQSKRADGMKARFARVLAHLDAMMKRDVVCDECGGAKTMDSGAKCPSCDGTGVLSARDAIKAMPPAPGETSPEEDLVASEEETDASVPAEEPPAPPADAHGDAAARAKAKLRADARLVAQQKRSDAMTRITERRANARAALLIAAGKVLGESEKLDGKSDLDVKRAVLAKVAAHVKLDGAPPATVELLYANEMARIDAATAASPNPSDALRRDVVNPVNPGGAVPQFDGNSVSASRADVLANAWKRPAAQ